MKNFLPAAGLVLLLTACNDSSSSQISTDSSPVSTGDSTQVNGLGEKETREIRRRAKEVNDSTKMLDKRLEDPKVTYDPDSLR